MRKFDLLEKLEMYQIDLLIYLAKVGGTATQNEVLQHLDIGEYFLDRLIESLIASADESNASFSIKIVKRTIVFQTKPDYSLHNLYDEMIITAPKYKILNELFLYGNIDALRLCKKINISDSTYYRKINELNSLLKEFDLTIQNGFLIGTELQIRFFYVSFYLSIIPRKKVYSTNTDLKIPEIVNSIQDVLATSLSILAKTKLTTYLNFLKRRYAHKNVQDLSTQEPFFHNQTNSNSQKMFLHVLKKSHLYHKISQSLKSFLSYYSFKMLADEPTLLLLFILGEEIIPANSPFLTELDLIEKESNFYMQTLNMKFVSFMEECFPNTTLSEAQIKMIYYYLTSCGYHHLLFNGEIHAYLEPLPTEWRKTKQFSLFDRFVVNLKLKYPALLVNDAHDCKLLTEWGNIMKYYEEQTAPKLLVGIYIEGDFLYKKTITNWWIKHTELTSFVHAEPLSSNNTYDLVISNIDCSYLRKQGKSFFFLTDYYKKLDIIDLDHLLTNIYTSKNTYV